MIPEITELKEIKKMSLERIISILNTDNKDLFHLLPVLMNTYTHAENAIGKISEGTKSNTLSYGKRDHIR